jgi:hypothetical protein
MAKQFLGSQQTAKNLIDQVGSASEWQVSGLARRAACSKRRTISTFAKIASGLERSDRNDGGAGRNRTDA